MTAAIVISQAERDWLLSRLRRLEQIATPDPDGSGDERNTRTEEPCRET